MSNLRYTVVLEPGESDERSYVVSVPAFPEIHTEGEAIGDALVNAHEAVLLCLEMRSERNEAIPASDTRPGPWSVAVAFSN
jgi:predicted RNase H-like HicB family nuclease